MPDHITSFEYDNFNATMIAEGCFELAGVDEDDVTDDLVLGAWQHIVDNGTVWQLQGSFGRQAAALIDAGHLSPAEGR